MQHIVTVTTSIINDGIYLVGAQNSSDDYLLWQKSINEDRVHFECYDQSNSGYDIVLECTLDKDGIHIVLKNQQMVHFYFVNCPTDHWENLVKGLKTIYKTHPDILEVLY
jgi:hypothetical protein